MPKKKKETTKGELEKHPVLWAVWGNGYGFRGPYQVFWDDHCGSWWTKDENEDVQKIGLHWNDLYFSFSSANKKEVQLFVKGYSTCARIVRNSIQGTEEPNEKVKK